MSTRSSLRVSHPFLLSIRCHASYRGCDYSSLHHLSSQIRRKKAIVYSRSSHQWEQPFSTENNQLHALNLLVDYSSRRKTMQLINHKQISD